MAKCRCKIYRDCKILPWKNFRVDDINAYLSSSDVGPDYQSDYYIISQYFKHKLETSIKINIVQALGPDGQDEPWEQRDIEFNKLFNWNYMSIQNGQTYPFARWDKTCYYFIIGKKWLSESCVEFQLKMDVINTFLGNVEDQSTSDIILSEKTFILREHKDRWFKIDNYYIWPRVDLYSEGIDAPLYKTSEQKIITRLIGASAPYDEQSYYLIYRNHDNTDNAKVDIFLCGDDPLPVDYGSSGFNGSFDLTQYKRPWFSAYECGYIYGADTYNGHTNVGATILVDNVAGVDGTLEIQITDATDVVRLETGAIIVGTLSNIGWIRRYTYSPKGNKKFKSVILKNVYVVRDGETKSTTQTNVSYVLGCPANAEVQNRQSETGVQNIGSISDVDRTDPLLLKIIKLPYCPFPFVSGANGITPPDDWALSTNITGFPDMFKYAEPNKVGAFTNENMPCYTDESIHHLINPLQKIARHPISEVKVIWPKSKDMETKLLHSDYYQPKFVYDSFSYVFRMEYYASSNVSTGYRPQSLYMDFSVSSAMNSKMMFSFKDFDFSADVKDIVDYTNVVLVDRNNELPIFNSAYMNYIKTGYNYDIKTKNRQLSSNITLSVIGGIGGVASFFAGPMGAVAGVSLLTASATNIARIAYQTAQAEQNIQQKLKSAEMQGMSVAGSDDLDLMTLYTNDNKAKLVYYNVSEKMEEVLFDLFYYNGYVANYQGVPVITTRDKFNFVQADVLFEKVPNLPNEIVEELSSKYKEGITFLHKFANVKVVQGQDVYYNDWDFEQQYENWETALL